jgi:hypothetical protein
MSTINEDFELELRSLPGVMSVGLNRNDIGEVDEATLLVRSTSSHDVESAAQQIARFYYPDVSVTVETAQNAEAIRGARVALTGFAFNEVDGVSQVTLNYDGRIGVGREGSGPLIGGANATVMALRELGFSIRFFVLSVTKVDTAIGPAIIVTLRSGADGEDAIGIAPSDRALDSSARATLDALNRHLIDAADQRGSLPS